MPIRILLVEDDPGDARLVREVLADAETLSYQIEHAMRLGDGLEHLAQGGIDVVLLDLGLPDAQGLETVTRTIVAAPELPIVVLTGLADEIEQRRAEAELSLLRTLALAIGEAEEIESALALVLARVCEVTGWATGDAWLPDRRRGYSCGGRCMSAAAPGWSRSTQRVRVVMRHATGTLGANSACLATLTEDGEFFELLDCTGVSDEVRTRWRRFHRDRRCCERRTRWSG